MIYKSQLCTQLKELKTGTFLAVQWLRFHLPMQLLIQKLRFHMPPDQKPKPENRNKIVTNSIKTLIMVHIKKKKKRI